MSNESFLDGRVLVVVGDITRQDVDAIVNAANSTLLGGGGVDGAIHDAGGPEILKECRQIRETDYPNGLPTGEAVITTGGNLPAKYVIHTVGPIYGREPERQAELLAAWPLVIKIRCCSHSGITFPRLLFLPFPPAPLVIQRLKLLKLRPRRSGISWRQTTKSGKCGWSFSCKETRAYFSSTRNSSRLSNFAAAKTTKQMIDTTEIEQRVVRKNELPAPLIPLERLAWNYWWGWAADGESVFRDLDPEIWEECERNPRQLLARTSSYRLAEAATDPVYLERVRRLDESFQSYMTSQPHVKSISITVEHPVAYFCAEFGVHTSLPLYSGGLGILAGDHLKSASDLGLPLVAVGLLYRYGYFRQRLRSDGWQEEHYGETRPSELPINLMKDADGAPLRIEVLIRERKVLAQVWRADVGRVALYLLDTNIPENVETDRWVTGHLYGGDRETRIVQEMLLGIGGVRLLRKLGVTPHVFHLNEGHSAFLTLELAREVVQGGKQSFVEAMAIVKQECVFTTHTPVAAGNDEFDASLVTRAFGPGYFSELGLSEEEFLSLGRVDPANKTERYGLTPLAIRMCRSTNGVSRKHGEVSRALWQKLWPDKKLEEIPISYITNGVHAPTWVSLLLRDLLEHHVGHDWETKLRDPNAWAEAIARIPDEELWQAHAQLKERLVAFIRYRSLQSRIAAGERADYIEAANTMFDPAALTIGFARRVAGYKRWNLLLTDQARLARLINNEERPVQFVFAGKAHPQDEGSKLVLQQLAQWKYDPSVRQRAVFLEDYDQEIARQLVQSVDVWLNVPRRPQEASGTSGEKVAINGGLNLSILDGWWMEGYDGTNGFAIGNGNDGAEVAKIDALDAESLYRTLELEVVPTFYHRDEAGLPRKWIAMMKRAIQTLAPQYNSDRMVEEYARKIY